MKRKYRKGPLLMALALVAGACGGGGGEAQADRVVEVAMTDNAFQPNALTVAEGETVTFRFTNNGSVVHDAFIGDAEEQKEHGEAMDAGDMEGHNMEHGEALLLDPGDSGELTYTFDKGGEVLIGCHQPGHYEAGMKSTVSVS